MQTTNLTWDQAKNLLLTGMCRRVKYSDLTYENEFYVRNGEFYADFHGGGELKRQPAHAKRGKFKVVS